MSTKSAILVTLGRYAFLFFLLKGLAWLCVPAILAWLAVRPEVVQ